MKGVKRPQSMHTTSLFENDAQSPHSPFRQGGEELVTAPMMGGGVQHARGSKRQRSSDGDSSQPNTVDDLGRGSTARCETWESVRQLAGELLRFVEPLQRGGGEIGKLVLEEMVRVASDCIRFDGRPGDCYESIRCLHEATVSALIMFGKFVRSACGAYIVLSSGEKLAWVAAVGQAAHRLLRGSAHVASQLGWDSRTVVLKLVDCCGFGWADGMNYVPWLSGALWRNRRTPQNGDIVVLLNAMLTDGGVPTVARSCGLYYCVSEHRYGAGVAFMSRDTLTPLRCEGRAPSASYVVNAALLSGTLVVMFSCVPGGKTAPSRDERNAVVAGSVLPLLESPLSALLIIHGDEGIDAADEAIRHTSLCRSGLLVKVGEYRNQLDVAGSRHHRVVLYARGVFDAAMQCANEDVEVPAISDGSATLDVIRLSCCFRIH